MGTKILQTDLARDALYTKVNTIADEKQDVFSTGYGLNLEDSTLSVKKNLNGSLGEVRYAWRRSGANPDVVYVDEYNPTWSSSDLRELSNFLEEVNVYNSDGDIIGHMTDISVHSPESMNTIEVTFQDETTKTYDRYKTGDITINNTSDLNLVGQKSIKTYIDAEISSVNTTLNSKSDDNAVVHLTGDETITGTKTFNNSVSVKNTEHAYNEKPSSTSWTSLHFKDKNGTVMGVCEFVKPTTDENIVQLNVFGKNGSWASNALGLGINSSGVTYTFAPTPAVSANGSDIATTAYVNNKLVKVSTLPASPDSNVYYFIPE